MLNLFTFSQHAFGNPVDYPNQDELFFELFKKEFDSHISTIEYVGMDFYKPEDARNILKHCAKIANYDHSIF